MNGESSVTSRTSGPAVAGSTQPRGLKEKAAEEFRRFVTLFLYLWVLFGVFVLNQGIVMREEGVNFTMQGFALVNALVFAKVVLVFEMFDPGGWLRKRPLIYSILYETLLVTVLLLVVHVLEKVIEGLLHGRTIMDSLPSVGGGGLAGLLSASVVMFVALLPLFGLRNLALAMAPAACRRCCSEKRRLMTRPPKGDLAVRERSERDSSRRPTAACWRAGSARGVRARRV